MALFTIPSITKGTAVSVTLNKTDLFALAAVVADAHFSDSDNVKRCVVEYNSDPSNQRKVLDFDLSQASPTASLLISVKGRDTFLLERLVLEDFDGDILILERAELPSGLDISIGGGGDPTPDSNVSFLLRFNGNLTDTIQSLSATTYGTLSYDQGISGQALNASSGAAQWSMTDQFAFGTSTSYTVEMWVKPLAVGMGTYRYFFAVGSSVFGIFNDNKVNFDWFNYNNAFLPGYAAQPAVTADEWFHFAISYDATLANNGGLRVFINGVQYYQRFAASPQSYQLTTVQVLVGASNTALEFQSKCLVDNVRVSKGIARYTANFTPPTSY